MMMMINPASLPSQPFIERTFQTVALKGVLRGESRLDLREGVVHLSRVGVPIKAALLQDKAAAPQQKPAEPAPAADAAGAAKSGAVAQQGQQAGQAKDDRTFWERVFNLPPLRERLEKALTEKWKFPDVRPRHVEWLLTEEGEEARLFFMDGINARQYQRIAKEYKCGFEDRNGRVVDDSIDTLAEYGPELIKNYSILMDNREPIKRYFAGVFREGRIGTQSLIRISNSMWFGTFEAPRFRQTAQILHNRFQVPNHVIGPMLASVGDSWWLRQVLMRRSAPQEFQQLLGKITAMSNEDSGNAFAPALQLLVLGEEHKIPFASIDTFVEDLKLQPKDFGPFSAVIFNLAAYRLASEIKCPTFAQFLRRELDEFGPDLTQESARLFLLSFREFKENGEALQSFMSPQYSDTKAFLRGIGTPVPSTIWNMERIAVLTQTLTPEKRAKVAGLVRELSEEVKVADIMFLAEIADNDEEVKLLLNRNALLAAVKDIKIDRIVERSRNDLVQELEREVDIARRNGLFRTVRRLLNRINEEKRAYTEKTDPSKLSNIQLSRLLIFHRSIEMPGFLDTLGWNVSLDLQNDRSEGGGYLGYDKDMAMVTIVSGQPGNNRQYRPANLMRAPASLALFHNHAFKDTFAERYLGFFTRLFSAGKGKNKNSYAGPSGWIGAMKGDITAAAQSELPSFIITKIGHPSNPDGSLDRKALLVDLDWIVVDQQSGEAFRSDRGVFSVPYYGDDKLGKLKWPSGKEMKRRERELREKCPPIMRQNSEAR